MHERERLCRALIAPRAHKLCERLGGKARFRQLVFSPSVSDVHAGPSRARSRLPLTPYMNLAALRRALSLGQLRTRRANRRANLLITHSTDAAAVHPPDVLIIGDVDAFAVLRASLHTLSQDQLVQLLVNECATSPEFTRRVNLSLEYSDEVQLAVDGVLLSPDLLPHVLEALSLHDQFSAGRLPGCGRAPGS